VNYRWAVVTRVAGILLAAGGGTRLGQPKATVELGAMTLAERGVWLLRDGGAAPVLVITGAVPVEIPGTAAAHNPDWASGMGSSLALGLRALLAPAGGMDAVDALIAAPREGASAEAFAAADVSAVVIALADQPLIGSAAVRRLIDAHAAGAAVVVAAYQGKPRNPVLIPRGYWAAVADAAAGDTGARPFLRAHPELVTLVECGDVGRPDDIDTPEDLARVRGLLLP
jgi:CTP:molybdopterin cytidylyltransferase MocA